MGIHKITFSKSNWTGGTDAVYFDDESQLFYADQAITEEVTASTPPTREMFRFDGYFAANSTSSPGAQYTAQDGTFTDALWDKVRTLSGTTGLTIYAQGTKVSNKLTISANGGAGGTTALYCATDGSGWFFDDLCAGENATKIERPAYDGKLFRGAFNGTSTPGTQYIGQDGTLLAALLDLNLSSAKTIYALWATPYKITISANSGTGGDAAIYFNQLDGTWSRNADFASTISAITPYARECYRLIGYKASNSDTAAERIAADGTIDPDWTPTANATIYARWALVSYKVTVAKSGGTGGTDAFFAKAATSPNEFYADDQCANVLDAVSMPSRVGYSLLGVFSASSAGTEYIDRTGVFTSAFLSLAITSAKTVYTQWKAVYKFTLDAKGGDGGTGAFYFDPVGKRFYADQEMEEEVASVTPPVRECFAFGGYWSAASGGTQYVDATGDFTDAMRALEPTGNTTLYARWTRSSWKVTLDANGGEGGFAAFYSDGATATIYSDDQCAHAVSTIEMPSRAGYDVLGFYETATGGSRYVGPDGAILTSRVFTSDAKLFAHWSAKTYVVTFDYAPGTGSTSSKTVTFGQAVGTLPSASYSDGDFSGWMVEGQMVTASTVWNVAHDVTATAVYAYYFGGVTDWFGLGASWLVPESSTSGDEVHRVDPSNGGRMDNNVNVVGCTWRNPSVTYRVVADGRLDVNLGKAFAAVRNGSTGTFPQISGYMIVGVTVHTALGEFPTVTVTGTANEGYRQSGLYYYTEPRDAINKFNFTVDIKGRARAQNLMGCLAADPEALHELTLTAGCTPVVLEENGHPCASDVVDGLLSVSARVSAYMREAAPTPANGFANASSGDEETGTSRLVRTVQLRKAMV